MPDDRQMRKLLSQWIREQLTQLLPERLIRNYPTEYDDLMMCTRDGTVLVIIELSLVHGPALVVNTLMTADATQVLGRRDFQRGNRYELGDPQFQQRLLAGLMERLGGELA